MKNQKHILFLAFFVTLLGVEVVGAAVITNTSTASGSWTAPAGVTLITTECWGGGGGGGGDNTALGNGAGGGGGGAYARLNAYTVIPGNAYSYTVGAAGGAGGSANGTGGTGGSTFFVGASTLNAAGGAGGVGGNSGAGGNGGAAGTTGDVKFSGGNGRVGSSVGGGGGGSAGTASAGTTATSQTGAAAVTGGGPGGSGGSGAAGGTPASGPGGGGGGGDDNLSAVAGGAGYVGQVRITFKAAATVTLSALSQNYTGSPLTPTATTAPAGLTIIWANAPQTAAGSYAVTATISDTGYQGSASGTFVIKVTPTVSSWPTATAITYGQPLSVSTLIGGTASVPGNFAFTTPATMPNAGTASQSVTFTPADTVSYNTVAGNTSVTVDKANQTITFGALAARTYGDAAFGLTATASSGLGVSYVSSDPAVATVSGSTVTILKAGSTTLTASQAGDVNYNAASAAPQTLVVDKADQTITFGTLAAKTYGDAAFGLTATASSGLAVSYVSSDPAVATVSGSTVSILKAGGTTIIGSQAGNGNFNAAASVPQALKVNKAALAITANSRNKTCGETVTFAGTEFTATGLQNGETVGTVTLTSSGTASAATVGAHNIIPDAATGGTFASANYTIIYNDGTLTVVPAAPAQVRVETAADGSGTVVGTQTIAAGSSITVYAITRDMYGNFVSNAPADTWSLVNIAGGVTVGDLVAGGNSKSAIFSGHRLGSACLHASLGTLSAPDSGTLNVTLGPASAAHSLLNPATAAITANGMSTQPITVRLRDANSNEFTAGGATIIFARTGGGTLASTMDNGDGTYSTTLTAPTATGVATVTATVGGMQVGTAVGASASAVTFTPGVVSAVNSAVSPATPIITANGTSAQIITVQARDANNNNLTAGGETVLFAKMGGGTLSGTTDNGNGSYTATLTAPTVTGAATVTATLGGVPVGTAVGADSSVVTFAAGPPSAANSRVSPATAVLTANGTSTKLITVQARDANNNALTVGGAAVVFAKTGGGTLSGTTDNGNGTYAVTLTAPAISGSATVTATLGGVSIGTAAGASSSVVTFAQAAFWKIITIDHNQVSAADQADFPVLVKLTDADLAAHAQSSGNDIFFATSDGTTRIPYEREKYTSATGELVAWVKVPLLSSTVDTVIYMYYGNSGASDQQEAASVWNTSYKGVWHVRETGSGVSGEYKDGTANAVNGTLTGVSVLKTVYAMTGASAYRYDYLSGIGSYTIVNGDCIEYDVYWTSVNDLIAFDYTDSLGSTNLRDSGAVDQNGLSAHPATDLSARALNKWYHRKIAIPAGHVGKTINTYYDVVCEADGSVTKTAYLDNIRITRAGAITKKIYSSGDSGAHVNHLTANASAPTFSSIADPASSSASGLIGNGLNADGVRYVKTAGSPTTALDNWTLGAWVNPGIVNQHSYVMYNGTEAGGYGFGMGDASGGLGSKLIGRFGPGSYIDSGYTFPSANAWYYVVITRASGTTRFYVNGVQTTGTSAGVPLAPTTALTIGNELADTAGTPFRYFSGVIDEPRICAAARSAGWIATEYNNQNAPSSFYDVGEEAVYKATPMVTSWPLASTITYGQTLADSTLTGGEASVPGSFAYTTSAATPEAGTASQSVTFTPTDTASYNTVVGDAIVSVSRANQAITFGVLTARSYGDASFALTATANSGLAVSYVSSDPAVATITGSTVTILKAGSTTITASQAGSVNYNAAVSVPQVLTVNSANQIITFGTLTAKTYGDVPFALTATASSGLAVSYVCSDPAVATIAGSSVTILKTGSAMITASQAGNGNYNAAATVPQVLTVNSANQTITFGALATRIYGDAPFALTATASSGLALSYVSSDPAVATVAGSTVTILKAGSATVTASQAGNGNYNAAASVPQVLTVNSANQAITFGALSSRTYGDAPFALTATANSGLTVSYASSEPNVATVAGSTVTILKAGSATITATQAGNVNYNAAVSVPQTLTVNKAGQTITFGALSGKSCDDGSFGLTATASSGLAVSYVSSDPDVASVTDNTVTILKMGVTTITAIQSGNSNFNAATSVPQMLTVVAGAPTQVRIEDKADGSGLVVGDKFIRANGSSTVYAITRDAGSNFVANVSATWSLTNLGGRVVSGDLVPQADGKSAIFTAHGAGAARIKTVASGLFGQSGMLNVPLEPGVISLPDFEGAVVGSANPGYPDETYFVNDTGLNQYAEWTITTNGIESGSAAVARPGPNARGGSSGSLQAMRVYYMPLLPNTEYTLGFWYKAVGVGFSGDNVGVGSVDPHESEMQLQLFEYSGADGSGSLTVKGLGNIGARTNDWTYATYTFTTDLTTHSIGLKFGMLFGDGNQANPTDSFYIDTTKALNVTNITAGSKVYDGTTTVTLNSGNAGLVGVQSGHNVTLLTSGVRGAFSSKTAGSGKPVPVSGLTLNGSDAGLYTLVQPTMTADIMTKGLTVTGVSANGKDYDGSLTTSISSGSAVLVGVQSGDVVTLAAGSAVGTFAEKNVASGKPVTVFGLALDGADAGNYTLTQPPATADISRRSLAISATGVNKGYDGTADANATLADNRVAGDVLAASYSAASFADKNVGAAKPVSVTGISISGTDAGNYSANTAASTTANISAQAITVRAASDSRIYNGTTSSTPLPTITDGILRNPDTIGCAQHFADKNVGAIKMIIPTCTINDGNNGSNYTVTLVNDATGEISAKALTVTATGVNKGYDGTTDATVTLGDNRVAGDVLAASYSAASFADKNVGTAKPVSVSGISIAGTDAANYSANNTACTTANIAGRVLAVTATGVNKGYDGTTDATVTLADNRVAGDVLAASYSVASFADKNVGTAKPVSISGITIAGTDAANYSANNSASTTANIADRALTVTATGVNKGYDGTTDATVTLGDNRVAGDVLAASYTAASFADKNVGTAKPVSVSGILISGSDAANYSANNSASTTANIAGRTLAVTATGVNKGYDGTTDATVTLGDNRVTGDVLAASYSAASFADKNVGAAKPVSISGITISGTDAGNYTANTAASTTANIAGRALTVTAAGVNKGYDGTTDATVTLGDNRVAGDVLAASYSAASFADKNVGTAKPVSVSGISISGTDAGNYTANNTASTTADIAGRALAVTATGVNKGYDGTTDATVTLGDNRVAGDILAASYSSASFADKNVGAAKPVSVSGISISGTDAANYLANNTASTTANIAGRALTVTAAGVNKGYDGTTDATVTLGDNRVAGDVLAASYSSASFADKNVGTAKLVSVSGITIAGTDAGNYTANNSASTTANIAGRALAVTATGVNKGYDGTTDATVTLADNRVAGDVLAASYSTASFADKHVGTAKPVSVSGISIAGTDAGNYTANNTASTTGVITPKLLTVTADNKTRIFGAANPPLTATYSGFVSGENLGNSGMTGSPGLSTLAAGTTPPGDYPINVTIGTLAAANYAFLTLVDGLLTVAVFEPAGAPGIAKIESEGGNVVLTMHVDSNEWCSVIAADGAPVDNWKVLDTLTSAPPNYIFTDSDVVSTVSSRFYRVVIAHDGMVSTNLATYAVYVKPMVTGSWYRVSMPIEVDPANRMDSGLGEQLAHGLHGDNAAGDRLYAMNSAGGWDTLRLNSNHQWTTNGVPVALEINPCQGFWIKRMSGGVNTRAIYTGMTRTNAQSMVFRAKDWHLVAWPFATSRRQDQGAVPGWGFAASGARKGTSGMTADQLIVGEGATAASLFLNTDGNWYRAGATTPAWDVAMRPGEACYYYHSGSGFTWTATQE
ncbi:MAG: DUF2341 domain-containing protein [bacterium]